MSLDPTNLNVQGFAQCAVPFIERLWMISPYVRRLRLGAELRALRAAAGLTHEQVAKRIGGSRAQVSRLENGHVVDLADVMKILYALGVGGERWASGVAMSPEAGENGWGV